MRKPTNPPAFPFSQIVAHTGMTLRDYFAAAALQGFLACPESLGGGREKYAEKAYGFADAMLAEREKGQP